MASGSFGPVYGPSSGTPCDEEDAAVAAAAAWSAAHGGGTTVTSGRCFGATDAVGRAWQELRQHGARSQEPKARLASSS